MRSLLGWGLAWMLGLSVWGASAPPPVAREFRGMWIATVGNVDWPSKPGLPVAQQQEELRQLLDSAVRLRFNVVVFQVRTACDALYNSPLEPWSEYLTGRMGQAPKPAWDPLQFAVAEAHTRGLELHAWFNPFRARYHQSVSPPCSTHVSIAHPEWLHRFGRYLWLDPGNPEVREYSLRVILDVARRYDVDGIHIDDYFYPYPEMVPGTSTPATFNDDASFKTYRDRGGRLEREDWRRDSVNQFVQQLNDRLHQLKPWLKFGVSPFGIWRPMYPIGIKGLDSYATLFADSRRWLRSGWADYFAPQLYWPTGRREQDYSRLLEWWATENAQQRLMISGLASANIGKDRPATDISRQVRLRRSQPATHGVLFWNASSLKNNLGGIANELANDLFHEAALVPETPWLGQERPPAPSLGVSTLRGGKGLDLKWHPSGAEAVSRWVLQYRYGDQWNVVLLSATSRRWALDFPISRGIPDEVWLRPVGRTGMLGGPAVWSRPAPPSPRREGVHRRG